MKIQQMTPYPAPGPAQIVAALTLYDAGRLAMAISEAGALTMYDPTMQPIYAEIPREMIAAAFAAEQERARTPGAIWICLMQGQRQPTAGIYWPDISEWLPLAKMPLDPQTQRIARRMPVR